MKARYLIIGFAALMAWSCSRKSAAQLYDEGKEAEEQQNFQLAVQRFDEVIDRFQESSYAESSLSRSAVIYNNDLHDIRKAVSCYQKIYSLYPAGKQAPTALF